jgi:hypothetical protein
MGLSFICFQGTSLEDEGSPSWRFQHQSMPERGPGQPQPQPTRKIGSLPAPPPPPLSGSNGWTACCIVRESSLVSRSRGRARPPAPTARGHCRRCNCPNIPATVRATIYALTVVGVDTCRVRRRVWYNIMHDCTVPRTSRRSLARSDHTCSGHASGLQFSPLQLTFCCSPSMHSSFVAAASSSDESSIDPSTRPTSPELSPQLFPQPPENALQAQLADLAGSARRGGTRDSPGAESLNRFVIKKVCVVGAGYVGECTWNERPHGRDARTTWDHDFVQ